MQVMRMLWWKASPGLWLSDSEEIGFHISLWVILWRFFTISACGFSVRDDGGMRHIL